MKNALGHFGYLVEGIRDLNTLRPYRVRITADGERLDGDYLFGAVANSTSIAGMMKLDGEQVVLDDGRFELLLVPNPKNAAELQNLIWALLNQQYDAGWAHFPPCHRPPCGNGRGPAMVAGWRIRPQPPRCGHHQPSARPDDAAMRELELLRRRYGGHMPHTVGRPARVRRALPTA